jgi:hypothetical protein
VKHVQGKCLSYAAAIGGRYELAIRTIPIKGTDV